MKKLLYVLLFVPLALFGQDNYSLSFDGVDDYVICNNQGSQNMSTHTISAWVNLNDNVENLRQYVLVYGGNNTGAHHWVIEPNGQLQIGYFNSNTIDGFMDDNLFIDIPYYNDWLHITASFDGDSLYLYFNGNIVASTIQPNFDLNSSFFIGHPFDGAHWNGLISTLNIWNKKLTQQEIGLYMNCPPLGNEDGLVGLWNFNEGSGNTVYDLSGNGSDGIIYGATYSEDSPEQNCIEGCTDVTAFNYNPEAHLNDDSCYPVIYGCLDPDAFNFNDYDYDFVGNELTGINGIDVNTHNGICIPVVNGCLDVNAYNFDQTANTDDGSCEYSGCMNSNAINFDETATIDDEESCIYSQEYVHGLWNEVDDGAIEYEYLQEEYNTLNANAINSSSSLQQALDTWNTTIDLSAGWNMFGYGCPTSIDVAEGLSNHTESIIITKDNNGNVYMPEFGFNGIGDFTPGFGYQIKLTEAIEDFSLCDWYVNDIPEDNIVSLQEENDSLQAELACHENPQVGNYCFGGIIFYVDSTGQNGLVAALEDLIEEATDPYGWGFNGYEWGCSGENVNGADGTSIGTGYQNTMDIVNQGCDTDNGGITAAQAALNSEINGYNDWYLPSKNELEEMYYTIGHLGPEGNIGGFRSGYYWSSSRISISFNPFTLDSFATAWGVGFDISGSTHIIIDDFTYSVRPIRSF